jgi:hypothetical protein
MQGHAGDDQVEPGIAASLAGVHHLEADMRRAETRNIAPALGDHRRRDVGQHEMSMRVELH